MENPNSDTRAAEQAGGQEGLFSIPDLINVLYRGRALIVVVTALGLVAGLAYSFLTKPLYRATAQIRPGIVSYTPDGAPLREWALKDITKWFEEYLYWSDFKEDPDFSHLDGPPKILADFIPSSLVTAGGDVITLTTLSPDPALAGNIIQSSIESFNYQARMDSLGSSLYLTLRGGDIRMAKIRDEIESIVALEERVDLDIAKQEREIEILDLRRKEYDLSQEILRHENTWRREAITVTEAEVTGAKERLAQAESLLRIALQNEGVEVPAAPEGGGDPRLDLLLQAAGREQAGRVGELLLTINQLSETINQGEVMVDSLQARIGSNEVQIQRLGMYRDVKVDKEIRDVRQKITDLEIQRDRDLPYQKAVLKADLVAEQVKMNLVSPLQSVGRMTVTDKPVRPRKLLATAILTTVAFFASFVLVFILEYYRKNRAAITRKA